VAAIVEFVAGALISDTAGNLQCGADRLLHLRILVVLAVVGRRPWDYTGSPIPRTVAIADAPSDLSIERAAARAWPMPVALAPNAAPAVPDSVAIDANAPSLGADPRTPSATADLLVLTIVFVHTAAFAVAVLPAAAGALRGLAGAAPIDFSSAPVHHRAERGTAAVELEAGGEWRRCERHLLSRHELFQHIVLRLRELAVDVERHLVVLGWR